MYVPPSPVVNQPPANVRSHHETVTPHNRQHEVEDVQPEAVPRRRAESPPNLLEALACIAGLEAGQESGSSIGSRAGAPRAGRRTPVFGCRLHAPTPMATSDTTAGLRRTCRTIAAAQTKLPSTISSAPSAATTPWVPALVRWIRRRPRRSARDGARRVAEFEARDAPAVHLAHDQRIGPRRRSAKASSTHQHHLRRAPSNA
jgi:hypothetical protein